MARNGVSLYKKSEYKQVNEWTKSKWTNKREMDLVGKVNGEINNKMMPYRNGACWFDNTGTMDMALHWQKCLKQYVMTTEPQTTTEGFANIIPPTTWKNVEAIHSQFKQMHLRMRAKPQGDDTDAQRAFIIEQILEHNSDLHRFDLADSHTFWTMVVLGEAYQYTPWTTLINSGHFVKKPKELKDDEIQMMQTMKQLQYIEKKYKTYDDYDVINVPNQEMWVSPAGTRFYGRNNMISKKCWEKWISFGEFQNMFKNDPFAKNVSKVEPSGIADFTYSMYFTPDNVAKNFNDMVRLRIWEDVYNDEILIIANDILIKEMYFPDSFKGVSMFTDFHYVDLPNYHYTPGLASVLAGLQDEEATLKNMIYDQLHLNINPPTYVNSLMAEEYMQERQKVVPGAVIPVEDINGIKEHQVNPTGITSAMQMLPMLMDDSVSTTGMNPRKFGTIQRSGNATEVQSNDQASYMILMKAITNFADSKVNVGKCQYLWIKEKYKYPVTDAYGNVVYSDDEEKVPKLRKIMLEGIELTPDDDDKTNVLYHKYPKIGFHPLDLTKDLIDMQDDPTFYIDEEDIQKLTKPIQEQKIQNALAQYSPFAALPGQPAPYGGPAILNITKLLATAIKTQDFPADWMIEIDGTRAEELKEANKHVEQIVKKGLPIVGEPGASNDLINYEQGCLQQLETQIQFLQLKVQQEQTSMSANVNPQTGEIMPTETENQMMDTLLKAKMLELHINSHRIPAGVPIQSVDAIMQGGQAGGPQGPGGPQNGPQGPQGMQPNGGPQGPMGGGGQAPKAPVVPTPTPMSMGQGQ